MKQTKYDIACQISCKLYQIKKEKTKGKKVENWCDRSKYSQYQNLLSFFVSFSYSYFSDKYRSEVAVKIDTVKDQGLRGGFRNSWNPPSLPSWLRPWSVFMRLEKHQLNVKGRSLQNEVVPTGFEKNSFIQRAFSAQLIEEKDSSNCLWIVNDEHREQNAASRRI